MCSRVSPHKHAHLHGKPKLVAKTSVRGKVYTNITQYTTTHHKRENYKINIKTAFTTFSRSRLT